MVVFSGEGVFPGIAFGRVFLIKRPAGGTGEGKAAEPGTEWQKFENAKNQAAGQLLALVQKAKIEVGDDEASIIDVQRLMLDDTDFTAEMKRLIYEENLPAAAAVERAGQEFSSSFAALEDPYMRARATDVADAARRVVNILRGQHTNIHLTRPSVVVADELTPSETMQLNKSNIRAFVTREGSATSHATILARTLGIPSLVQSNVRLDDTLQGKWMAVDSGDGKAYLEPDQATIKALAQRQKAQQEDVAKLENLRGLPAITKDGRSIKLFANIGSVEDVSAALENGAEGIGLFRTEFLFLGRNSYPSEEEQFAAYRQVAENMNGAPVLIRTLDIGADKRAAYLDLPKEDNPALGLRGVRLCFSRPEMFKSQLRAIYRASAHGHVCIMFPMITSLWEILRCKDLCHEVQSELTGQGLPMGDVPLGMMVETPAAAMMAEEFAKEVDFFSVGTNDLSQYTLATDRQNGDLRPYLDPHHPAILRMLGMVANAARQNGIACGICGELAVDQTLIETFLTLGYAELSMSSAFLLPSRRHIRQLDLGAK